MHTASKTTRMSFVTDKKRAIDTIARAADRSSSYIINEALEQYMAVHAWQIEHIKRAVAAADRGEFVKGPWSATMDELIAGV